MKNELSRFNDGFMDYDFFDEALQDLFPMLRGERRHSGYGYMRTDVKENENGYVMEVELPGLDKKDISIDIKDGYLNISASKSEAEKSKKENYIRRERSFSCRRSYYVGDIRKEDIKAKYENGILTISIPKEQRALESGHKIDIE